MTLVPRLPAHAEATIHQFLRAHVAQSGGDGVVLGLSGGIDSALCARLAVDALGAGRVAALLLPDRLQPEALTDETLGYAAELGIAARTVGIDGAEVAFHALLPELSDRVTWGNVKARVRMTVLYAWAREHRRLVVGTGNKSELLMGYFTKWGDGGADLLPIGDLYKTQVRELSAALTLPREVRERPPTAGLWEGQTDEEELGIAYPELDQVLYGLEQLRTDEEIAAAAGLPLARVTAVRETVERTRHKRRLPPIPKLGLRTVGIDWRE